MAASSQFPHLASWMAGAPQTHPLRQLYGQALDTDDPNGYRQATLRAFDDLIGALEAAKPQRLDTVRGDFRNAPTTNDLMIVRSELVAGAKLARAHVAFDFGVRKRGRPEPDLILRRAHLAIEVKARRINGLQDLEEELERALSEINARVTVHLACDVRPLFIKPADREDIVRRTLDAVRSDWHGTFAVDLSQPARAVSPQMRLSVRIFPQPPISSHVLVEGGWQLSPHLEDVEGEVLAVLDDEQKIRQAETMPTILLVEAARAGMAWIRPPHIWAPRLADRLPADTPFIGIAVMVPTLDAADAGISMALRANAPAEALAAARALAEDLGMTQA